MVGYEAEQNRKYPHGQVRQSWFESILEEKNTFNSKKLIFYMKRILPEFVYLGKSSQIAYIAITELL